MASHSSSESAMGFSQMIAFVVDNRGASLDHLRVQLGVGRDDAHVRADLVQHLEVVVVEGVDPVALAEQVQLLATAVDSRHQGERVIHSYGIGVVVGMLRDEVELRPHPARSYDRYRVSGHTNLQSMRLA